MGANSSRTQEHKWIWLSLFRSARFNIFLFVVWGISFLATSSEAMLVVFISTLTSDTSMIGWCTAVQCLSELPFFFFSDRILELLKPRLTILISIIVLVIRNSVMSQMTQAWMVLPVQMLNGLSVVLFWVAAVEVSRQNAPTAGLQASSQGLLAFMKAMGGVGGNLVGGWMFATHGPTYMYRAKAMMAATLALLWAAFMCHVQEDGVVRGKPASSTILARRREATSYEGWVNESTGEFFSRAEHELDVGVEFEGDLERPSIEYAPRTASGDGGLQVFENSNTDQASSSLLNVASAFTNTTSYSTVSITKDHNDYQDGL